MSLSAGLRLGPYQVQTPIGAGGMGEVYKGLDTRLGRTVAIKVLPPELVAARESRQRLEREARSLSLLSHPHICTLYDIGHQEGVDFLVMEYLEGEALERRLRRGPLRIAQALSYAIEIASALENAHHLGIIHRDLKPGNIMITKSGIKLLDFGLAKLHPEPAPMAIALTEVATETRKLTAQGMLLGTLQYMAPEQLEAKEVDARTDIFAFGAVLYEMITGHPAFTGQSKASLIAAVLSSEPAAISSRQPLSPLFLDVAVKNCLAKEPDERWQTAYDVKLQLQWVLGAASQAAPSAGAAKHQKRTIALAWALVVLVALISSLLTIAYLRGSSKQAIALITFIPPPENTTFESLGDLAGPPVLSPDGRFLAFVGASGGKKTRCGCGLSIPRMHNPWATLRALRSHFGRPIAARSAFSPIGS